MISAIVSMIFVLAICILILAWNFHRYVKLDVKRDELIHEELDGISQHLGFVEEENRSLRKELRTIIKRDSLDRVNTFQDISRKFNRIEERLVDLEREEDAKNFKKGKI